VNVGESSNDAMYDDVLVDRLFGRRDPCRAAGVLKLVRVSSVADPRPVRWVSNSIRLVSRVGLEAGSLQRPQSQSMRRRT
jgi:hypothetical protein